MALSSNALCAKAKAMYGGRLTDEIYLDLMRKQNLGDIVSYLKAQTSYSECLKDINIRNVHRQQIEDCLDKEYFKRCGKLMKYADKSNLDFYMCEIISIEINLIIEKLYAIKAKNKGKFNLSIPDYLAHKTSFNIYGLINIETYEELVKYLEKTRYYKVLKDIDFQIPIDLNEINIKLQKIYYDNFISIINRHFKGNVKKNLLDILYTSIELKNISKIYRFKEYFHESEEMIKKSLFLEYSRLPKEVMNRLCQAKTSKDVLSILSTSLYHFYLDDRDYAYIEYYAECIKYNIARKYMRFSNNAALVYMTYCILQRIEIDNLKHIIEGVRYHQDFSRIEATLIYA